MTGVRLDHQQILTNKPVALLKERHFISMAAQPAHCAFVLAFDTRHHLLQTMLLAFTEQVIDMQQTCNRNILQPEKRWAWHIRFQTKLVIQECSECFMPPHGAIPLSRQKFKQTKVLHMCLLVTKLSLHNCGDALVNCQEGISHIKHTACVILSFAAHEHRRE